MELIVISVLWLVSVGVIYFAFHKLNNNTHSISVNMRDVGLELKDMKSSIVIILDVQLAHEDKIEEINKRLDAHDKILKVKE